MKKYLLLIDEEWFMATLSDEEVAKIKGDIEGLSNEIYTIKLDNGEIVEIGIKKVAMQIHYYFFI